MKKKRIELLAPAGDYECFLAAINAGADAVYLGGKRFGARAKASNFSLDEIAKAVLHAHLFGCSIYVTVNTLIKNREMAEVIDYVKQLYSLGVDAIIVQDFWLAQFAHEHFPGMEVHASTQTTIHNADTILAAPQFDRVILARELSKSQIKHIIDKTGKDVEVFAHGALCFAFSGQCLMSSMIGGRSGNRGLCAQPCRKPYNVTHEQDPYLMSTADLCLIEHIPELIAIGVRAIKIEGRMKPKEYVGTAVGLYRKAIDSCYNGNFNVNADDINQLKAAFNRSFTEGFFGGVRSVVAPQTPTNRGSKKNLDYPAPSARKVGRIDFRISIRKGERAALDACFNGKCVTVESNFRVAEAGKHPLTKEKIMSLLRKISESVFKPGMIDVELDDDSFMPFSVFGELRDRSIALLTKEIGTNNPRQVPEARLPGRDTVTVEGEPKVCVLVHCAEHAYDAADAGADVIYYNLFYDDAKNVKEEVSKSNSQFFLYVPEIMYDDQMDYIISKIDEIKPDGLLVGNPGILNRGLDYDIHLNYSFNLFNDYDLMYWRHLGIISAELNKKELEEFEDKRFMVFAHGRIVVMKTKNVLACSYLEDATGARFPVRKNPAGYAEILNAVPVGLFDHVVELQASGVNYFFLDLDSDVKATVLLYKDILWGKNKSTHDLKRGFTRGHYRRGIM
jgi:putative protease